MNRFPVLYVEDEENDVVLLEHAFTKTGVENPLHAVKDGRAAMDYLAGNATFADRARYPLPGLILLDLNLPFYSGIEVLAWLRQQPQIRRLPVVIFSSSGRPDDIAKAYDAGANGYLVKPNSVAELSVIAQALRDFWMRQNQLPEPLGASPEN